MSAEIIQFPLNCNNTRDKNNFPVDWPYTIAGVPVNPPQSGQDYLELCKEFMEPEDYTDILIGIMDKDAYDALETPMQNIIKHYYWYMSR